MLQKPFLVTLMVGLTIIFGVVGPALAVPPWVITHGNSSAVIDTENQAGMKSWTVNGVENLAQQWFWYRVGPILPGPNPENSIDTLTVSNNTGPQPGPGGLSEQLGVTYTLAGQFRIDVVYVLVGGTPISGQADMGETILITNLSVDPLNFHFFQYSNFDLGGNGGDDSVQLLNANTFQQSDGSSNLNETVATPAASRYEAAFDGATLAKLNNGVGDVLNNVAGPLDGDVTWAFQWDFNIPVGGSKLISKDKHLQIPAPGAALLGVLGLSLIARRKRKGA